MQRSILFIIHMLSYGGAEKVLTYIANELSIRGHKVYIYTFEDSKIHYRLDSEVVHISEKNICTKRYVRRFVQIFQIRNIIKTIKPNIAISFLSNPNLLSIIASAFTKTPIIISERGDPTLAEGFLNALGRFIYGFAEGAVFQTEAARQAYPRLTEKCCIIPNPVTVNMMKNLNVLKKDEIAFVGRFELVQKRQDLMLHAFKIVVKDYPEIKLVFYGSGQDEDTVRTLVNMLKLTNNVIFAGVVDNIVEVIQNSRMFVLTSDYEGIPNALIEAMAIGLPVIATDCSPGGARMLIDNMVNGILVAKGDVDAIADAIKYLLKNNDIAFKLGAKAMEIAKKYDSQKIVDMWEEYINKVSG